MRRIDDDDEAEAHRTTMAKSNPAAIGSERGIGRPMDDGGDNAIVRIIPSFIHIRRPRDFLSVTPFLLGGPLLSPLDRFKSHPNQFWKKTGHFLRVA